MVAGHSLGRWWLVFGQINVRTDRCSPVVFEVVLRGVHGGGGRLLLVFQALPLGVHLLVLGGQGLVLVKGGLILLVASSLLRGCHVGLFQGFPILKRGTSKDEVNRAWGENIFIFIPLVDLEISVIMD